MLKDTQLKAYKSNTILDFGQYKGLKLKEVISDDLEYISDSIENENHFCVEYELLMQIEDSISQWTFIANMYKLSLIEQYKKPENKRNIELITTLYSNIYLGICYEKTDDDIEF
ncbi:hypothetical protein E2605_06615 [Dysgonomonas capnocytophagoides]|uniref:Exodeoxyribonuclease X-like C-terminal domain-containing protein n=1 Tax=Dysgonomonas capnocytophagoides TaxID=45254 RepID=A0A4Y8L3U7_9BACT|nr:hypothetical protein [Dysgonomonas capnocytophagoides]TFD97335.1 hypothetical protein E2605_06615 [Dysgonomonas capnocytophagoides]